MAKAQAASQPTSSLLRQGLPYVGLGVGVWASIAPYALLGPDLNAAAKTEFVDHVVPGALVIVLSAALLVQSKRGAGAGSFPLLAGFGVLLAGLWMTATHLPLVKDAQNDIVATDVTAWHTVPGIVVMILGGIWAASFWSDAGAENIPSAQRVPPQKRHTSLSPEDTLSELTGALSGMGAQITTASSGSLLGVITTQQNANVVLAILLLFLCLVPGVVYLVVARKTLSAPFSVQIAPDGTGTRVTFTGQGKGATVVAQAVSELPV